MADAVRRYFREIAEERSADRWLPILGGLVFSAGILISVLDLLILQQGRYKLTPVSIAGFALLPAGLGIRTVARRALGKFFSPVVKILPEHRLVTNGPYGLVRHPIYLSEILSYVSIPMIFESAYGLVVMLAIVPILLYRIRTEEEILISRFGQEYIEYARKTKKLIPYIY